MSGFATVVFDCDMTLVGVEGIDVLAKLTGADAGRIAALTQAAMDGALPLEAVYGKRLAEIRPGKREVAELAQRYRAALAPDAGETVAALRELDKTVRVISGGLRPPVEALAAELGIAADEVAAVGITFAADGSYADFERGSPLARAGGKAEILREWQLPRPALLVGDGSTDAEAADAVDAFAAYMGFAYRAAVAAAATWTLSDASLAPVLALAADEQDRRELEGSRWAELLARGDRLLEVSA